jgi:hypothetical protein
VIGAWLYWILFAAAVGIWLAVPLVVRWEARQDERDAETWSRVPGATR